MVGVVVIVFLISHVLNPNPAALWAGAKARVTTVTAIEAQYHLKDPLLAQLYFFVVSIFTGNLGTDPVTGQSISSEIWVYAPNTIEARCCRAAHYYRVWNNAGLHRRDAL